MSRVTGAPGSSPENKKKVISSIPIDDRHSDGGYDSDDAEDNPLLKSGRIYTSNNTWAYAFNMLGLLISAFTIFVPMLVAPVAYTWSVWFIAIFGMLCSVGSKYLFSQFMYGDKQELNDFRYLSPEQQKAVQGTVLPIHEWLKVTALGICISGSAYNSGHAKYSVFLQLMLGICVVQVGWQYSLLLAGVYFAQTAFQQSTSFTRHILLLRYRKWITQQATNESTPPGSPGSPGRRCAISPNRQRIFYEALEARENGRQPDFQQGPPVTYMLDKPRVVLNVFIFAMIVFGVFKLVPIYLTQNNPLFCFAMITAAMSVTYQLYMDCWSSKLKKSKQRFGFQRIHAPRFAATVGWLLFGMLAMTWLPNYFALFGFGRYACQILVGLVAFGQIYINTDIMLDYWQGIGPDWGDTNEIGKRFVYFVTVISIFKTIVPVFLTSSGIRLALFALLSLSQLVEAWLFARRYYDASQACAESRIESALMITNMMIPGSQTKMTLSGGDYLLYMLAKIAVLISNATRFYGQYLVMYMFCSMILPIGLPAQCLAIGLALLDVAQYLSNAQSSLEYYEHTLTVPQYDRTGARKSRFFSTQIFATCCGPARLGESSKRRLSTKPPLTFSKQISELH